MSSTVHELISKNDEEAILDRLNELASLDVPEEQVRLECDQALAYFSEQIPNLDIDPNSPIESITALYHQLIQSYQSLPKVFTEGFAKQLVGYALTQNFALLNAQSEAYRAAINYLNATDDAKEILEALNYFNANPNEIAKLIFDSYEKNKPYAPLIQSLENAQVDSEIINEVARLAAAEVVQDKVITPLSNNDYSSFSQFCSILKNNSVPLTLKNAIDAEMNNLCGDIVSALSKLITKQAIKAATLKHSFTDTNNAKQLIHDIHSTAVHYHGEITQDSNLPEIVRKHPYFGQDTIEPKESEFLFHRSKETTGNDLDTIILALSEFTKEVENNESNLPQNTVDALNNLITEIISSIFYNDNYISDEKITILTIEIFKATTQLSDIIFNNFITLIDHIAAPLHNNNHLSHPHLKDKYKEIASQFIRRIEDLDSLQETINEVNSFDTDNNEHLKNIKETFISLLSTNSEAISQKIASQFIGRIEDLDSLLDTISQVSSINIDDEQLKNNIKEKFFSLLSTNSEIISRKIASQFIRRIEDLDSLQETINEVNSFDTDNNEHLKNIKETFVSLLSTNSEAISRKIASQSIRRIEDLDSLLEIISQVNSINTDDEHLENNIKEKFFRLLSTNGEIISQKIASQSIRRIEDLDSLLETISQVNSINIDDEHLENNIKEKFFRLLSTNGEIISQKVASQFIRKIKNLDSLLETISQVNSINIDDEHLENNIKETFFSLLSANSETILQKIASKLIRHITDINSFNVALRAVNSISADTDSLGNLKKMIFLKITSSHEDIVEKVSMDEKHFEENMDDIFPDNIQPDNNALNTMKVEIFYKLKEKFQKKTQQLLSDVEIKDFATTHRKHFEPDSDFPENSKPVFASQLVKRLCEKVTDAESLINLIYQIEGFGIERFEGTNWNNDTNDDLDIPTKPRPELKEYADILNNELKEHIDRNHEKISEDIANNITFENLNKTCDTLFGIYSPLNESNHSELRARLVSAIQYQIIKLIFSSDNPAKAYEKIQTLPTEITTNLLSRENSVFKNYMETQLSLISSVEALGKFASKVENLPKPINEALRLFLIKLTQDNTLAIPAKDVSAATNHITELYKKLPQPKTEDKSKNKKNTDHNILTNSLNDARLTTDQADIKRNSAKYLIAQSLEKFAKQRFQNTQSNPKATESACILSELEYLKRRVQTKKIDYSIRVNYEHKTANAKIKESDALLNFINKLEKSIENNGFDTIEDQQKAFTAVTASLPKATAIFAKGNSDVLPGGSVLTSVNKRLQAIIDNKHKEFIRHVKRAPKNDTTNTLLSPKQKQAIKALDKIDSELASRQLNYNARRLKGQEHNGAFGYTNDRTIDKKSASAKHAATIAMGKHIREMRVWCASDRSNPKPELKFEAVTITQKDKHGELVTKTIIDSVTIEAAAKEGSLKELYNKVKSFSPPDKIKQQDNKWEVSTVSTNDHTSKHPESLYEPEHESTNNEDVSNKGNAHDESNIKNQAPGNISTTEEDAVWMDDIAPELINSPQKQDESNKQPAKTNNHQQVTKPEVAGNPKNEPTNTQLQKNRTIANNDSKTTGHAKHAQGMGLFGSSAAHRKIHSNTSLTSKDSKFEEVQKEIYDSLTNTQEIGGNLADVTSKKTLSNAPQRVLQCSDEEQLRDALQDILKKADGGEFKLHKHFRDRVINCLDTLEQAYPELSSAPTLK